MRNKFRYLCLCLGLILGTMCFVSCSKDDDSPSGSSIVGTWVDDETTSYCERYWTFKSNGDYESHLIDSYGDQPRYGTYILNNGVLTIKIRAVPNNNSAYTLKYMVQTLTKTSLVLVGEDDFKSFKRQ